MSHSLTKIIILAIAAICLLLILATYNCFLNASVMRVLLNCGTTPSENMATVLGGPITILRCLTIRHVCAVELADGLIKLDPNGPIVVLSVDWSETSGEKATSISEVWNPLAPNMWQAMSRKK